jgi:hypothetical protein
LVSVLRDKGFNVKTIGEMVFRGRNDENVFQLAKREDRILITHDSDFLNDKLFPPQGCPGIAVLPSLSASEEAFVRAFGLLLAVHGKSHSPWYEQKVFMPGDDTTSIRFRDHSTSKWKTVRFKFPENGVPMVWEEN